MPSYDQVLDQAIELPYEQREKLIRELFDSLHPQGDDLSEEDRKAAWATEIERRLQALERGEAVAVPHREAMQQLRDALKTHERGDR